MPWQISGYLKTFVRFGNIDFGREKFTCPKSSRRSPTAVEVLEQTVNLAAETGEWIVRFLHEQA